MKRKALSPAYRAELTECLSGHLRPLGGTVHSVALDQSYPLRGHRLVVLVDRADGKGWCFNHHIPDLDPKLMLADMDVLAKVIISKLTGV